MKIKKYIALFALSGLMLSCQDNLETPTERVFIKTANLGDDSWSLNAFGLDDGSVILAGWLDETADLIKFDPTGRVVWHSVLPNTVYDLWGAIPLSNGNIAVYGFDFESYLDNDYNHFTLLIYSPEGALLHSATISNRTGVWDRMNWKQSLYAKELSSGELAMAMVHSPPNNQTERVRLMRFDKELHLLKDRIYQPDGIVPNLPVRQLSLDEDKERNLLIQGRIFHNLPIEGQVQPFAFVMKLDRENYDPVYFETYGDDWLTIPSTVAVATDGAAVWAYAGPTASSMPMTERFSTYQQFSHSLGTEINVLKTAGPGVEPEMVSIKGFPKFAAIKRMRPCIDGGYLLSGTCNFYTNMLISNDYKLLVIKLDKDLRQQWMHVPNTQGGAVLNDAVEIPGGFLVSATINGLDGNYSFLVYKLDQNGNM